MKMSYEAEFRSYKKLKLLRGTMLTARSEFSGKRSINHFYRKQTEQEQVVKRRWFGLTRSFIGLEITDDSVKAAEMIRKKDGTYHLGRHGIIPLSPGVVDHGKIVDGHQLRLSLQKLWKMSKLKQNKVHFALPSQMVIVRQLTLPDVSRKQLQKIVNFEVKKNELFPFEDPGYDFVVLDETPPTHSEQHMMVPDHVQTQTHAPALERSGLDDHRRKRSEAGNMIEDQAIQNPVEDRVWPIAAKHEEMVNKSPERSSEREAAATSQVELMKEPESLQNQQPSSSTGQWSRTQQMEVNQQRGQDEPNQHEDVNQPPNNDQTNRRRTGPSDKPVLRQVMVVGAPQEAIEQYVRTIEQAGLKLLSIECKAISLYRIIHSTALIDHYSTFYLVHLLSNMAEIYIYHKGQLVMTRNVPITLHSSTPRDGQTTTTPFGGGHPHDIYENVAKEIDKSTNYFRYSLNYRDEEIHHIVLSGDAPDMTGLAQYMRGRFSQQCHILHHPESITNDEQVDQREQDVSSTLAVPMGLALRGNSR